MIKLDIFGRCIDLPFGYYYNHTYLDTHPETIELMEGLFKSFEIQLVFNIGHYAIYKNAI